MQRLPPSARARTWSARWRAGYAMLVFPSLLGFVGLILLGWSVISAVLARVLPRRLGAPLGRYAIRQGFRVFVAVLGASGLFRFRLGALDALAAARGLVVAPNHPTLMDVMLIASRLPRAVCITKGPVWGNPLLGGSARLAGYIRNDAALPVVRGAVAALRGGANLLIFPEGTRTRGAGPVNPLQPGFALMARRAGAAVQTILIETRSPFLRKGWAPWQVPPFPVVVSVRLGRRFEPSELRPAAIEGYFRDALAPLPPGTPPPGTPPASSRTAA